MTAKQYLTSLRGIYGKIASLQVVYQKHLEICKNTSQQMGNERVQTSFDPHKLEERNAELAQIGLKIKELKAIPLEAIAMFEELSDSRYTIIMISYYLNELSFREIEDLVHHDESWIWKLHDRAVEEFEVIYTRKNQ